MTKVVAGIDPKHIDWGIQIINGEKRVVVIRYLDDDGDPVTAPIIDWQATQQTARADTRWTPSMPSSANPGRHGTRSRPVPFCPARANIVPFAAETGTHAWLHRECWRPWHLARGAEAMKALSRISGLSDVAGRHLP